MKEWLIKMAKELGLPETATEEQVLAKLSERFVAASAADTRVASVAAQLAANGFKLDGDKLVKLESKPVSNPDDVARLAASDLENAKLRLAAGKATVDAIMAKGVVPPALKAQLDRVFSSTGKLESISLGKGENNSEVVIKGTIDILADLKALFDSIPGIAGSKLSTLRPADGQPNTGAGDRKPGELGRSIAERQKPGSKQKKEPAVK